MISSKIIIYLSILVQVLLGNSQYFYEELTDLDMYSATEFNIYQNETSESIDEFNNNFTTSYLPVEKNSSENNTLVRNTESADISSTISTTTMINKMSEKDISENNDELTQDYIPSTTPLDFSSNTKQTTTKNSTLKIAKSMESTSIIPKIITSVMIESTTKATTIESSTKISKSYILAYFNSTEELKISLKQLIILVFFSIIVCSN
ncbi:hypothetical protein BpHYR1_003174 [Brachionus plicatilis]|uniref:Uncharacterized protein n=1 Tax=Brachionus plicatilis TaxID=10195 RepID=A0A3M7RPK0_BRAPC|nr:hypothetical protein BpHYR1_003174 [Brachionus plicatilis]